MQFYKSESMTRPNELDFTSSDTTVFIRRNIREEIVTDEMSNEQQTKYIYDEAKIPKTEYIQTLHERQEETDEALQELILATFGGE